MIAVIAALGYLAWTGFIKEQLDLYRYPIAFTETVSKNAAEYDIPEPLLYAVIKTESSFEPDAVSRVGAKGLMQIMDDTNTWICQVTGMDVGADIFDPEVNIERGSWMLSYLYRQFGSWEVALAAYNAGYGNVSGWLADESYSSDGVTLHTIPFAETREYVKRITSAEKKYRELYFD